MCPGQGTLSTGRISQGSLPFRIYGREAKVAGDLLHGALQDTAEVSGLQWSRWKCHRLPW